MSGSPIGGIVAYAGDAIANAGTLKNQGWLVCDGSAVSRIIFGQLFGVIGTRHGIGDGSTTFNLPDYRGRFLRGTDRGTKRDPDAGSRVPAAAGGVAGDNTGSLQGFATARPSLTAFTTDTQGDHSHTIAHVPESRTSYKIAGHYIARWTDDEATTSTAGAHTHLITAAAIMSRARATLP